MFVVSLVLLVSGVSAASGRGENSRGEVTSRSAPDAKPVFYIYPHTGRLFHADYVRDNQIFQSLERTNFMRRGPFARRLKRDAGTDEEQKKHVYVDNGRIKSEVMKKGVSTKIKDAPAKSVLIKSTFEKSTGENRPKRNIVSDYKNLTSGLPHNAEPSITKNEPNQTDTPTLSEESTTVVPEKMVDGDVVIHAKNNDSDKTLLFRDSKPDGSVVSKAVVLDPLVPNGEESMKKTVMNDGVKLYPVYRGVLTHYPHIQRNLVYSPQMTVQMDLPEVLDYTPSSGENFTQQTEVEEGRGKRPFKKLAVPLLLALKLKTAIMLPLILGLVSLVALKGLWSGLTALGISAALGLKALVSSSGPRVVVQAPLPPPPPHVHHFPPHEYTEYWSRSDNNYFNDYRPNSWT